MYYIMTNMNMDEDPLSNDIFISITNCKISQLKEYMLNDLIVYCALYNHRDVKIATYKDNEWTKSNEFKILKNRITKLENSIRFVNYGHNIHALEDKTLRIPLNDRMLTPMQQNDKITEYLKMKWINELNWG